MTFEQFMQVLLSINPLFVLKIFVAIGLIFYVIFSLVVVRQVQLMSTVVEGITPQAVKIITLVHALSAIIILLIALLIL